VPPPTDIQTFEAHRELMFAVAYRMLGTVADAEDALQDAWLRWSAAPRHDVTDPRAYLTKVITNTSLNRLRAAKARREAYIGPWLPEPLLTQLKPDISERPELNESVSLAMLVVLESLTPDERAVFVLREVFGFSYAEIIRVRHDLVTHGVRYRRVDDGRSRGAVGGPALADRQPVQD
jgi:RNA polymerase sigma factor (sigma-70 family)